MSSNKVQMNQPYKVLIDIWGVMTSWDFIDVLKNYIKDNITEFIERYWDRHQIKDFIDRLREKTVEDMDRTPDLPSIVVLNENNKNEVIKSVVDNINWRETNKLKSFSRDIKEFYHSIWCEGYQTKRLIVHIFDDVVTAFQKWTSEDLGIKIYTFASGSAQHQKLFLSSTVVGDLNQYIMNGINSFHKYKYDSNKFHQIFSALLERRPQNILYLTDSPRKARAAIEAKFKAVVVLRPGNRMYSNEELKDLDVINTLDDLEFLIEV